MIFPWERGADDIGFVSWDSAAFREGLVSGLLVCPGRLPSAVAGGGGGGREPIRNLLFQEISLTAPQDPPPCPASLLAGPGDPQQSCFVFHKCAAS